MDDLELRSLMNEKLGDYQCDNVPDFDTFFTEAELSVSQPEVSTAEVPQTSVSQPVQAPVKPLRPRLWTFVASVGSAAAAAVVGALLVFSPSRDREENLAAVSESSVASQELATEPSSASERTVYEVSGSEAPIQTADYAVWVEADAVTKEAVAEAKGSGAESKGEVKDETESDAGAESETAAEVKTDAAAEAKTEAKDEPETEAETEENEPSAVENSETTPPARDEESAPAYERSLEEAYAEAHHEKARSAFRQKHRTRLGLNVNQSNNLMAVNSLTTAQSTVAMVTNNYQNNPASFGRMGLRQASTRNEWKSPANLSKGSISSYEPVYNLPLSAGVSVAVPVGLRWDIITGLQYTFLSANTSGVFESGSRFALSQTLHYVGIPLKLSYRIYDRRWGVYASAGGGLEKGLKGKQVSEIFDASGKLQSSERTSQSVAGVQPYASLQVGGSLKLTEHFQLFLEPGVAYYFDTDQPTSIRTKSPFNFNLGGGVRIGL